MAVAEEDLREEEGAGVVSGRLRLSARKVSRSPVDWLGEERERLTDTWHRLRAPWLGSSSPDPCGSPSRRPRERPPRRGSSPSNRSTCTSTSSSAAERTRRCSTQANSPLCHLLQVGRARQPKVERVQPLWEELGLEELAHHRRAKERRPRKHILERLEILRPWVDGEPLAKGRAELRKDMLEDKGVPVGRREGLSV